MKILTVVGARPQFIKAKPVSDALAAAGIDECLVHTGQHYDEGMSAVFFSELGLRTPDANLGVGSGSHASQTARMLTGIETLVTEQRPDYLLVYGDTNSTLAGALAAAKLGIPVAHVEAGLRSFNRHMPEEVNRVVTDHLSTLHFCPSDTAVANLAREGITTAVHNVGDVMHDALIAFQDTALRRSEILRREHLQAQGYYLVTIHRAENTDDGLRLVRMLEYLATLDLPVILPLHPRTRAVLTRAGYALTKTDKLRVVEPMGYLDTLALTRQAAAVLTDSGGLQKEAYWFGVRCLTLREETEWIETLENGWNQICGLVPERVATALRKRPHGGQAPIYGTGTAARQIAAILESKG